MKQRFAIGMILCCLFSARPTGAATAEDIRSHIEQVPHDHPRLIMKLGEEAALRHKIDSNPLLREAFKYVTTYADGLQHAELLERKKTGKRLLSVSMQCLERVMALSFSYRLTGSEEYAARAEEEMLAVAAFTDWNPSHFLDVAEMTAALAIGYDWVYEGLTPEARQRIKKAIIEKGLKTSLNGGWWVRSANNWNQVCHGGLVLGALAVLEDEPGLAATIIERAVTNVPEAMAVYAPDGAYPEGPGYWKYGTTYNVILISALESVFGTDFGLSQSKGFLESAEYYQQTTGPTGLYFNYADCGPTSGISAAMYWFAEKKNQPSLLWREKQVLESILSNKGRAGRMFPLLMVWAGGLREIPMPGNLHGKFDGKAPVAILRSGWKTDQEVFVGIKGGSPNTPHGHMDIGSFVMDADGVRWAEDLGNQSYHDLESKGISLWSYGQDAQRWDVFRLNHLSHNILVVDGQQQQVDGQAPIVSFSDQGPMPHAVVDLSSVYKGQLSSARRLIGLRDDRSVLIEDEVESLDRKTTVRWGMVTRADVTIESESRAVLRRSGQQLSFHVVSPAHAKLEVFETEKPPKPHDTPNKGTRMIGFRVELPPSSKERLVVVLDPGNVD